MSRSLTIVVLVLTIFSTGARFFLLEDISRGAHEDETSNAMHLACLAERGEDANGTRLPFFSLQYEPETQTKAEAGTIPPTHLYFGALWVKWLGSSLTSVRALSAALMTLWIVGIYFLSTIFLPKDAALLTSLIASISPWGFALSRFSGMVAFEPPLLVFALYAFMRGKTWRGGTVAGLLLSAFLYSYPPARAQLPLLLIPLSYWKFRKADRAFFAACFGALGILAVPLMWYSLTPEAQLRVTTKSLLRKELLWGHPLFTLRFFLEQIAAHFNPRFLFTQGDLNLRHSTQFSGELSWLEALAWASALPLLLWRRLSRKTLWILGGCLWGILSGVVPSALSLGGIPHALRSAGSLTFYVLAAGLLTYEMKRHYEKALVVNLAVATIFTALFIKDYFVSYPSRSALAWHLPVHRAAIERIGTKDWKGVKALRQYLPDLSIRYYFTQIFQDNCLQSLARLKLLETEPPAASPNVAFAD